MTFYHQLNEGELWPSRGSEHAEGAGLLVALGHCSSHFSPISGHVQEGTPGYGKEMQGLVLNSFPLKYHLKSIHRTKTVRREEPVPQGSQTTWT